MATRQSELIRVLTQLAGELPNPHWVALVDDNGLVMACVPAEPPVDADRISAMTAASVLMGERILSEIEAGDLRYASIAGSERQIITVMLNEDRLLSIGIGPEVAAQSTFGPLSRSVPELMRTLRMRFTAV